MVWQCKLRRCSHVFWLADILATVPSEVLGKTSFCSHSDKYANMYKKNSDLAMVKKKGIQVHEIAETCHHETFVMVSHKQPFWHSNEIVGACGFSLKLPAEKIDSTASFSEKRK